MAKTTTRQLLPDVNANDLYFIKDQINKICGFYDEQNFIDVTFKLSNPTAMIPAHRLILAAASPYFNDLFKSAQGLAPVIELNNVHSDTFERLMTFCYTGKTLVTIDNVDAMLKAAMVLKLDRAVLSCVDYIFGHMTEYTLQRAYCLQNETQSVPLYEKLFEYVLENFMEVTQTPEFLSLNAEQLQALIESDKLNVSCEKDVFDAVKRWYEYDAAGRQQKLPDLIGSLRLNQLDTGFLLRNVQLLPGCEVLALRAITWTTLPTNRTMVSLKFTTPRKYVRKTSEETTLLAVGGSEAKGTIFQYNQTEDEWHKYAEVEHDAKGYGMVLMEDNIIYIGGERGGIVTNGVKSYNLKTKTWTTLPSMTQIRKWPSVVLLNSNVYAIGGHLTYGELTKSAEKYSPGSRWKLVSSMITPRREAGAVALNDKIFVMGGYNGGELKSVECYDPSSNTWTQCADMNDAHDSPGVAVHNGCIYVIGGCAKNNTVERYDPESNKWTKICYLNIGRPYIGCVFVGDQLWAVGGVNSRSVSVYYAEFAEWIEKKSIPRGGPQFCYVVPKALLQYE